MHGSKLGTRDRLAVRSITQKATSRKCVWCAASSASGRNLSELARIEIPLRRIEMNQLIYLIGLIVVIMAILSIFGLR
jgi:hypothetical protein